MWSAAQRLDELIASGRVRYEPGLVVEGFEETYPVREETRPDGTKVLIEYHTKAVRGKLLGHHRAAATGADDDHVAHQCFAFPFLRRRCTA